MKILFIDAFSGVSGDKFNASLISAGADREYLAKALSGLSIKDEFELQINEKKINGIVSIKFDVIIRQKQIKKNLLIMKAHHHDHESRNLNDINNIIGNSDLTSGAKEISKGIFNILGQAESKAHGISIDKVHFHEVGAVDSIIDIVAAGIMLDRFKFDKIISTPIPTGKGFVKTRHGMLPVPAPATAEILKGLPVYSSDIDCELTTPTGAAIIKYIVNEFHDMPLMNVNGIGYGAGTKDLAIPNFLRVYTGEEYKTLKTNDSDTVASLQTNLDDCTPEQSAYLAESLLENGALDVYITPVTMKKSRQAQLITVICNIEDKEKFEKEIFLNSTAFGIRTAYHSRKILKRDFTSVAVDGVQITVKLGYFEGILIHKTLEYESVKKAVKKLDISYNELVNKANTAVKELKI